MVNPAAAKDKTPPEKKIKLSTVAMNTSSTELAGIEEKDCVIDDVIPVDRISNLPEAIICHILSFLPAELVVGTSVLSRSWRYHWTKTTDFHLVDFTGTRKTCFKYFGHMFLRNHNAAVSMNKLHITLKTRVFFSWNFLYPWIMIAIFRNLRVLILEFVKTVNVKPKYFKLPRKLYTNGTLEVLKLIGPAIRLSSNVVVSLPKLTDLELGCIWYDSDESLPNLISGAPSLGSLKITRANNDNMVACTISSRVLKRFTYCYESAPDYGPHYKLVIDTPSLEHLDLNDVGSRDIICSQALTFLEKVDIRVDTYTRPEWVIGLVQSFHRVKIMVIYSSVVTAAMLETLSSSFGRLTYLSIAIDGCDELSYLMDFIGLCPELRKLVIKRSVQQSRNLRWRDTSTVVVPKCFTEFRYEGFQGSKAEMAMLKFIFHHAPAMKRFVIDRPRDWGPYPEGELRLLQKTFMNSSSSSSAVSPACQVSISWDGIVQPRVSIFSKNFQVAAIAGSILGLFFLSLKSIRKPNLNKEKRRT